MRLIPQAIILEILCSMLLTFLYLSQTEQSTKISRDPAITTLIIAATYTAIVGYSISSGVVTVSAFNPAAAFGLLAAVTFQGRISDVSNGWICLIFAYVGALVAILLFEFVYKKAVTAVEEQEDGGDAEVEDAVDTLLSPQHK